MMKRKLVNWMPQLGSTLAPRLEQELKRGLTKVSGDTLVTLAEARLIFREAERVFRAEEAAKVRSARLAEAAATGDDTSPESMADWKQRQIELREEYERALSAQGLIKALHTGGAHVPSGTKAIVRGSRSERPAIAVK